MTRGLQEAAKRHAAATGRPIGELRLAHRRGGPHLQRIGWTFRAWRHLAPDQVDVLDLPLLGPKELGFEAALGARRASDRAELSRLGAGLHQGPLFWEGTARPFGPRAQLGRRERAALASYVTNAHWARVRLHAAGERGRAR